MDPPARSGRSSQVVRTPSGQNDPAHGSSCSDRPKAQKFEELWREKMYDVSFSLMCVLNMFFNFAFFQPQSSCIKKKEYNETVNNLICFLLGPEGSGLRFRLRFFCFCFWLCRGLMRKRHGVTEIEMNNDLNFSAMAHIDKQISRQISTIVFSNALVETLLIKLGDSALYVLFES